MAEIIDVPVLDLDLSELQAEAEETGKTIKDLKAEIKGFRESLENAEIGSDEFKSALEQLTAAQNELKQATKSSIDVVEGSYNALTRQMAEMKAEWKNLNPATEEGQRRMAELGQAINETNTKLKEMDASLGNYQRNVGNYGSAFEGVSMKIEGTAATFENVTRTTKSAADSIQLVEGALQMMGVESEEAEKAIRKVEGVMRFTDGLRSLKEAKDGFASFNLATKAAELQQKLFGKSLKATTVATATATAATNTFKKALIATGIGALIVAIGTLIANFDKVMKLFQSNSEAADRANESYRRLSNTISGLSSNMDKELKIMAIEGASGLDILAQEAEMTKEAIAQLQEQIIISRLQLETLKWWQKDAKEKTQQTIEEAEKSVEELLKRLHQIPNEAEIEQKRLQEELKKSIQANFKQSSDAMDKLSEKLKQWGLSKPALDLVKLSDQVNKDRKDLELALERNVITYDEYTKRLKKIDDNYKSDRETIFQSLYDEAMDLTMSEEDKQLKKLDEEKKAYEQKWKDAYNVLVSNNDATAEEIERFDKMQTEALAAFNKTFENNVKNVKKISQDNGWKEVIEAAEKELDNLDKLRERAIKSLALTETAINEEFEGFNFEVNIDLKFDRQEEQLKKLKNLYEEQLKIQKELDEKEKSRLQTLIDQAIAQGRSTEEVEELRSKLSLVGAESDALDAKLKNVKNTLETLSAKKFAEEMESINDIVASFSDVFTQLNDIGGLMGDEVASSIASALTTISSGINTAAEEFSNISEMQAKLNEMKKEGVDLAQQDALQADINKKKWGAYGAAVASGFGAAANMLSALAEQQDETTRDGFEKQKKLAIAAATMSMLQGIISAWTSAMSLPAPLSFITGGVMTAATATMGALQIANIKKQQFDSGGSTSVAAPSIPAISAGDLISRPVQTTNTVQGASTEGEVGNTRVYVVETDIVDTINKVNVAESEAVY